MYKTTTYWLSKHVIGWAMHVHVPLEGVLIMQHGVPQRTGYYVTCHVSENKSITHVSANDYFGYIV